MRSLVWTTVAVVALALLSVMAGCTKAEQNVAKQPSEAPNGVWGDTATDNQPASPVVGTAEDSQKGAVDGVWGGPVAAEGSDGIVHELADADFEDQVLNAAGYVLVDFNADWCGPCQALKPIYHDLAAEYNGRAKFVSVNVDDCPKTAQANKVRGIPDIRVFKDGKEIDKKVGFGDRDDFSNWVVQNVK